MNIKNDFSDFCIKYRHIAELLLGRMNHKKIKTVIYNKV